MSFSVYYMYIHTFSLLNFSVNLGQDTKFWGIVSIIYINFCSLQGIFKYIILNLAKILYLINFIIRNFCI